MYKKCQQNKQKKVQGRMGIAMTKIMLCVVTLILQGIEIFIFNFPSGPTALDKHLDIGLINKNIGNPTAMKGLSPVRDNGVLEKVHIAGLLASI